MTYVCSIIPPLFTQGWCLDPYTAAILASAQPSLEQLTLTDMSISGAALAAFLAPACCHLARLKLQASEVCACVRACVRVCVCASVVLPLLPLLMLQVYVCNFCMYLHSACMCACVLVLCVSVAVRWHPLEPLRAPG